MSDVPSTAPPLQEPSLLSEASARVNRVEPCEGLPATMPTALLTVDELHSVELLLCSILICLTTPVGTRLSLQMFARVEKIGRELMRTREQRLLSLPTCIRVKL